MRTHVLPSVPAGLLRTFHSAAAHGAVDVLGVFVREQLVDLGDEAAEFGDNPIGMATEWGERRLNVGQSTLMTAIDYGQIGSVRALLEAGVDVGYDQPLTWAMHYQWNWERPDEFGPPWAPPEIFDALLQAQSALPRKKVAENASEALGTGAAAQPRYVRALLQAGADLSTGHHAPLRNSHVPAVRRFLVDMYFEDTELIRQACGDDTVVRERVKSRGAGWSTRVCTAGFSVLQILLEQGLDPFLLPPDVVAQWPEPEPAGPSRRRLLEEAKRTWQSYTADYHRHMGRRESSLPFLPGDIVRRIVKAAVAPR